MLLKLKSRADYRKIKSDKTIWFIREKKHVDHPGLDKFEDFINKGIYEWRKFKNMTPITSSEVIKLVEEFGFSNVVNIFVKIDLHTKRYKNIKRTALTWLH